MHFLGYSASHKGYKCYHPPTSKIYISRHVIFDEDVFPYVPSSPTQTKPTSFNTDSLPNIIVHIPGPPPVINTGSSTHPPISSPSTSLNNPIIQSPHPNSSRNPITPTNQTSMAYVVPSPSVVPSIISSPTRVIPSFFRPSDTTQHPMVTRARTNSLKPNLFHTAISSPSAIEPSNFSQAIKHKCWQDAMKAEYEALMKNHTWSLVECPTNSNVVGCNWIYKVKKIFDGTIARHKARLVTQGFSQEVGLDFFDTFSSVIKPTTIRLVLSIALSIGWRIQQININNAFLNGELSEEVYMKQPKGCDDQCQPNHVCRLHKALYGLKQAPRAWFNKLKSYLVT